MRRLAWYLNHLGSSHCDNLNIDFQALARRYPSLNSSYSCSNNGWFWTSRVTLYQLNNPLVNISIQLWHPLFTRERNGSPAIKCHGPNLPSQKRCSISCMPQNIISFLHLHVYIISNHSIIQLRWKAMWFQRFLPLVIYISYNWLVGVGRWRLLQCIKLHAVERGVCHLSWCNLRNLKPATFRRSSTS